ncbi:MAG: FAD-dependent oxidoreductase [Ignavibacteria bacterium]|nr:FAD-dependent oxidoreductase [Ignavibacteria bacterium]
MSEKTIKLKDRKIICENTIGIWFDRLGVEYDYEPGQYAKITLLEPKYNDEEGNSRLFSIANAPTRKDVLMFSTRALDSAFNKNILELPLGTPALIGEPGGNTNLHKDTSVPAVFLIGGIGITPVRCMVEYSVIENLPYQMILFYANKKKSMMTFYDEFIEWAKVKKDFTFVPAVEEPEEDWSGEKGYITEEIIKRYLYDWSKPVFYIVGPPKMVDSMESILLKNSVNPGQIKLERFG